MQCMWYVCQSLHHSARLASIYGKSGWFAFLEGSGSCTLICLEVCLEARGQWSTSGVVSPLPSAFFFEIRVSQCCLCLSPPTAPPPPSPTALGYWHAFWMGSRDLNSDSQSWMIITLWTKPWPQLLICIYIALEFFLNFFCLHEKCTPSYRGKIKYFSLMRDTFHS